MTAEVFESVKNDPSDEFEIQNTLSIDTTDHGAGPLVYVDTNYKPERESEHPVLLSLVDAVKASAALIRATLEAYDQVTEDDPKLAWDLLRELLVVDNDVSELREPLTINLKPKSGEA